MSGEALSRLTGKSRRTVWRRLQTIMPAERDGPQKLALYVVSEALAAIYAKDPVVPLAVGAGNGDDGEETEAHPNEQELRRQKLEREIKLLDLEIQVKDRELISLDVAAAFVANENAACRARLLALPTKLAPLVLMLSDLEPIRAVLQTGIEEALAELSTEATFVERCL